MQSLKKNDVPKPRRNYRFKTDISAIDHRVATLEASKNDMDITAK